MPVNYAVQAQVVDIRGDAPKPTDRFYVDTNVWFWTVYGRLGLASNPPKQNRVAVYPSYLKMATAAGADVRWSGLSFSELAHQIEKAEFDIYRQTAAGATLNERQFKEFRHNLPAERRRVMQEVDAAWRDVESLGKSLPNPVLIDKAATAAALQELKTHALDGYDIFALQAAVTSGITQILTDDGDFCVLPNITLFTANRSVLNAAGAQGKLITR